MKKITLYYPALLLSLTILSGCSWLNKPYLYGNDSCGENKTAYVYSNGKAAICLNEGSVAYILCVRELSVSSEVNKNILGGSASVPIANSAGVSADFNSDNSINIEYASEENLAKARAKAIQTCVDIYDKYPYLKAVNE